VWLTNTSLSMTRVSLLVSHDRRDITEQTKTLENSAGWQLLFRILMIAITFQDLEGNILAWNKAAETIYGYSQAEALKMEHRRYRSPRNIKRKH